MPEPLRCPECGYTKEDAQFHMDHHLCKGKIPEPKAKIDHKKIAAIFGATCEQAEPDIMSQAMRGKGKKPEPKIEVWAAFSPGGLFKLVRNTAMECWERLCELQDRDIEQLKKRGYRVVKGVWHAE
jgi:hypothetical protein